MTVRVFCVAEPLWIIPCRQTAVQCPLRWGCEEAGGCWRPPFSLSSPAESGVFFRFPGIVCLLFLQVQGIQCIAKLWKKAKTCSIQSPFCHVFCLFFIVFPSYGIALCRLPFRYVPGNSPLSFHYYRDVPLFCLTCLPPRPWQDKWQKTRKDLALS